MSDNSYDVIVIGAGPAGYPAAIRAAQNGLKVACIDEWKNPRRPCPGAAPPERRAASRQALLGVVRALHRAHEEFATHGIGVGSRASTSDDAEAQGKIVKASTRGVAALFKAAGVTPIEGPRRLLAGNRVEVTGFDGAKQGVRREARGAGVGLRAGRCAVVPFDGRT